ncbi:ORF6C domain-containing protein [Paenibacillus algorifonticola]|uniref:ORF6C domain-containing protein n=2 Tax=Paenibacillus algorifonticola TaxID=684063 RepID=A0A1I2AFT8_9BACL|nr:ORF6C domain-containing protein [Paenibacillus algorifonticola]
MIAERDKLIAELRARVIIRSPEQKLIQRAGRERVKLLLGGRDSAIYRRFSRKYFSSMWNGYRDKFNVRSFRDTRESDFDNAVLWIGTWQARGPLRISAEQIELELKEHEE